MDCLLLDQSIGLDAKIMGKPHSVAWIDYEKAYDRVPHKWVMKVLKTIRCPGWIRRSIELFSKHWATVLELRTVGKVVRSTPVKYNRGLFQGDSLSPLLFCLAIAPISQVLNTTKGYTLWHNGERNTMSHLLYMNDLKIYTGGPDKLREAMECVEKTSNAIGMRFGVRKCGTAHMQKGKVLAGPDNPERSEESIRSLEKGTTYKYLGLEQLFDVDDSKIKACLINELRRRLHKVWGSHLNGKNAAEASNMLCASLLRYSYPVLKWTQSELPKLDRMVRKIMRKYQYHHYNSAIERVNLPRSQGGRGLCSFPLDHDRAVVNLARYLHTANDPLIAVVVKHQKWLECSKQRRTVLKEARLILRSHGIELEPEMWLKTDPSQNSVREWRRVARELWEAQTERLKSNLAEKSHQGSYHRQVTNRESYVWLSEGRLRPQTEALILAAQDDVLHTRWYQNRILKNSSLLMCRECGKAMETVKHILNMCEPKGFSLYKERHDRAILIVLWRRLKEYGFKQEEPWYQLEAKPVYENRSVKILWDPSIPTDDEMTERRPDLVVEDRLCKSIFIIEMSVPTDSNINGRWQEKFQKYQKLAADMRKQFRGYRIKVVPMIIGALGTVDTLLEDLRGIPKLSKSAVEVMRAMQRTVLCLAVRILRRHLSVEGLGPGR